MDKLGTDENAPDRIPNRMDIRKLAQTNAVAYACWQLHMQGVYTYEQMLIVMVFHFSKNVETLEKQIKYQIEHNPQPKLIDRDW